MPLSSDCFTLYRVPFTSLFFASLHLLQVKALTEEATNRKALIESLKRRLNVATTEKIQYETSCAKLKEDLGKKVGHGQATKSVKTPSQSPFCFVFYHQYPLLPYIKMVLIIIRALKYRKGK